MIKIDNTWYKATWIKDSLTKTAEILNGPDSGRMQGTYKMYLQYGGTFFNYRGKLHRDNNCSDTEWNNLFITLSNPKNDHKILFPFGNNNSITQNVYIAKVESMLNCVSGNKNIWDKIYEVEFVAMEPAWKPGGNIGGLS